MRPLILVTVLVISLSTPAGAQVKGYQNELSPRGVTIAQCIAFYQALILSLEKHYPEVKTFTGNVAEGPQSIRVYAQAEAGMRHMQRAFNEDQQPAALREAKRVIQSMADSIGSDPMTQTPAAKSSWRTCRDENLRLDREGLKIKGFF